MELRWLGDLLLASQLAKGETAAKVFECFSWPKSSLYALHITSVASNIEYRQYSSPNVTQGQRSPEYSSNPVRVMNLELENK